MTNLNQSSDADVVAAAAYEGLYVPALFEEWSEPVLDAARVGPGEQGVEE